MEITNIVSRFLQDPDKFRLYRCKGIFHLFFRNPDIINIQVKMVELRRILKKSRIPVFPDIINDAVNLLLDIPEARGAAFFQRLLKTSLILFI